MVVLFIGPVFAVLVAITLAAYAQVLDHGDACRSNQHRRHECDGDLPDAHDRPAGKPRAALSADYTGGCPSGTASCDGRATRAVRYLDQRPAGMVLAQQPL